MNEEKFSSRQSLSLITMFLIGQVFIMYNGNPAKTDVWISILIAYTAMLPMALLYARLLTVLPGRNLYDLFIDFYGPLFGRAVILLYVLFSLHVGSLVLKDLTSFMQVSSLTATPQYVSAIFVGVLCIYCVKAGINTLGRYAALAFPVYLAISIGITLLSTSLWSDPSHLPPPFYNGIRPVLISSVNLAVFPYADAAMLPFVLQPLKQYGKARRVFILGYSISAAVFLMQYIRNVLILGSNFTFTLYFPSYMTISLIDIGDFLQRIEVAVGAVMFMGVFIKLSVYIYVVSLGLSKLLNLSDYRKFAAPVGMLVVALSQFAYPNIVKNLEFSSQYYVYYSLPFSIVIPLITCLVAERRRRKRLAAGERIDEPPAGVETPVAKQGG